MYSYRKYLINVIATGAFVLALLSILLFLVRWLPQITFQDHNPIQESVLIRPSGLVPEELENDPNIVHHSVIIANLRWASQVALGVLWLQESPHPLLRSFPRPYPDYYFDPWVVPNIWNVSKIYGERHAIIDRKMTYFDKKYGLAIYCHVSKKTVAGKTIWVKDIELYAGPNGVSTKPEKSLGRFIDPVPIKYVFGEKGMTLYDGSLKSFFKIDFAQQAVVKGTKLSKDDPQLVQFGWLSKNSTLIVLKWEPPLVPKEKQSWNLGERRYQNGQIWLKSISDDLDTLPPKDFVLVLDESGTIRKLDIKTLEFAGIAGYLPVAASYPGASNRPDELLAYEVLPFTIKHQYSGLIAASISRENTDLIVSVYNQNGSRVAFGDAHFLKSRKPGGIATILSQYILENLHPPVLSLISYLTAYSFKPIVGYQGVFILPNSIIANYSRSNDLGYIGGFFMALLIIMPSIIISILLSWRVCTDAGRIGLSKDAKLYWIIGTIAFGLIAYVTFKITRPKLTLVTCQNCGKPRRPDMVRCHHCQSRWRIPELMPPTWRVVAP